MDDLTDQFEAERPRLERIAAGVLGDRTEAQDIVQQAWIRMHNTDTPILEPAAWLTTVTTRLCLDRLRQRVPQPIEPDELPEPEPDQDDDPAEHVALADAVGVALTVVLEQLTPAERVAFVLHDTFGVAFDTIATVLDASPAAARKLASRARSKVTLETSAHRPADWEVVDAFLAASRGGDFARLLHLLAPDVVVTADPEAIATGTPARLDGRDAVAAMFDGAAQSALPVYVGQRPGAAWFLHGEARVAFDFTVRDGVVEAITFRADPQVLAAIARRSGAKRR